MTMVARALCWLGFAMGIAVGEPLSSVREIRASGAAGLLEKREVKVAGVVTAMRGDEYPEFTLQDPTGGLVAHLDGPVGGRVRRGQRVEIEGLTDPMPPHPRVKVTSFQVLGEATMPEPVKAGVEEMTSGAMDCVYVEFSGVIRRATVEESIIPTRIVLDFGPQDRRLGVWVSHFDEALQSKLVPDTAVTVRGICYTWRSASFQPVSTFIAVADPAAMRIERPAGAVEMRPLENVLAGPTDDFRNHRQRVEGTVTLAWPDGQVVIQNERGSAIWLKAGESTGLRPGDRVTAEGFPTRRSGRVVLDDAVFQAEGGLRSVRPKQVTAKKLAARVRREDVDARLVMVPAVFDGSAFENGSQVLSLRGDGVGFQAYLPKGVPLPEDLEQGDKVEVTGVCRVSWSEKALRVGRSADQFDLQLQDGSSIALRSAKAWWTQKRLAGLAAGIFVVLLGSIVWAMVLRRRAGSRSDLLVQEIRARRDAELLAAERMRLAADLHDTLSQSLSGAAMQLEVAAALSDPEGEAGGHFSLAKRLLDRSREDLRRTVWDLSPSGLGDLDLAEAMRKLARDVCGKVDVTMEADGKISAIPERIRAHLFRVGQEAMGNALTHGKPRKVNVRIQVEDGLASLRVEDDGVGFDPATAPGPEEGHFGLRSLKERVARLGGELAISSSPRGTRVEAVVPLNR